MPTPCLDHVGDMFNLAQDAEPSRVPKYSRIGQLGLKNMPREYLLFETMRGPYLNHIFALALFSSKLEQQTFQD